MAVKSNHRMLNKKKGPVLSRRRNDDVVSDEIALRDEIFELKRQVMILKRTNEQNLIKFRKYEDEAKRKDRQIEQLMDPRKNSEITKILSTKGAAILMNLKDQNNSLVQMILTKDMQIRRLVAEIKTSKLYGASRKTETHRAEVVRLRNLLVKSQEILRENIDLQQRQREESIYLNGCHSFLNMSPGSSQSSPREVEELRFTIQSLETHVKYSRDLLAKKNQQIMNLTEELNTLKRAHQRNTTKNKVSIEHDSVYNYQAYNGQDLSNSEHWIDETPETLLKQSASANQSILDLIKKTVIRVDEDDYNVPHSAPSTFVRFSDRSSAKSNRDSPRESSKISIEVNKEEECQSSSLANEEGMQKFEVCTAAPPETYTIRKETNAVTKEQCRKSKKVKEKWKNAVIKYKQNKNQSHNKNISNGRMKKREEIRRDLESENGNGEKERTNKKSETHSESSDFEIHEFEIMEKKIQMNENLEKVKFKESKYFDNQILERGLNGEENGGGGGDDDDDEKDKGNEERGRRKLEKNNECLIRSEGNSVSINIECGDEEQNGIFQTSFFQVNGDFPTRVNSQHSCEKSEKGSSPMIKSKEIQKIGIRNAEDTEQIKIDGNKTRWEIQNELPYLKDDVTVFEEIEAAKETSSRAGFLQRSSSDSSFDSDTGYPIKRQVQIVKVEVEINPVPERYDVILPNANVENSQGERENYDADDVNNDVVEGRTEENDNEDSDDDDDVIVR